MSYVVSPSDFNFFPTAGHNFFFGLGGFAFPPRSAGVAAPWGGFYVARGLGYLGGVGRWGGGGLGGV